MEERLSRIWRSGWCLTALVLLGLGLRSYHYLRQAPLWHDEAALLVNVLERDYGQLLGPLRFHEAAPPLFLWLERATSQRFGDSLLSLRLPSFLASCLALLLLVPVARRLLAPEAVPWTLLLFACSEQLSWHACEAKPYAFDVLTAVVLIALYLLAQTRLRTALLLAALLAPLLLWLSYPACFLEGGLLVALLPTVWRRGAAGPWTAYLLTIGLIGAAFLILVFGPVAHQRDSAILDCWTNCFPDWHRPWTIPLWTVASTLDVGRYCCKPLGQPLMVLAGVGAVLLWRRGRQEAVLLTLPLGLSLLAACLHRYPYGGARVMVHDAPALLLLIGAAVPGAFALLRQRSRLAAGGLLLLLLLPVATAAWRVVWPWCVADPASASTFVESCRTEGDAVMGNDWTHLYYFRHVPAFHQVEDGPTAANARRLWVVYTAEIPAEQRLASAHDLAPAGWHLIQQRSDFNFTTVALFAP